MNFEFKKPDTDEQDLSKIPNDACYNFAKTLVDDFTFALDIGAHIGTMSRKMAKDFEFVFSFEPHFFEYTKMNTKDLGNVTVYPFGLGNKNKTEKLFVMEKKTGGSSIVEHPNRVWQKNAKTVNISIKKLDDFHFDKINFIKIDVESYEYFVIDGARKTLQKHSPLIMVEYLKKYQHPKYNSRMTDNILSSLGYSQIKRYADDYIYKKV